MSLKQLVLGALVLGACATTQTQNVRPRACISLNDGAKQCKVTLQKTLDDRDENVYYTRYNSPDSGLLCTLRVTHEKVFYAPIPSRERDNYAKVPGASFEEDRLKITKDIDFFEDYDCDDKPDTYLGDMLSDSKLYRSGNLDEFHNILDPYFSSLKESFMQKLLEYGLER